MKIDFFPSRRGHFLLESGYHTNRWLDLDALFVDHRAIAPSVDALAAALRTYNVDAICGPMRGGAFLAQLIARALAVEFWFTERVAPTNIDGMFQVAYPLPPGIAERARGKRVAIVDDVMSAGSALRGAWGEVEKYGARTVAAGALLVLGSAGVDFFRDRGIPLESVSRENLDLWPPAECRLCAAGVPLERIVSTG